MKTFIASLILVVLSVFLAGLIFKSYQIGYDNGVAYGKDQIIKVITTPSIPPDQLSQRKITDDEFTDYFLKQFIDNADSANITMEYNNTGDKGYGKATLTIGIDKKWDNSQREKK